MVSKVRSHVGVGGVGMRQAVSCLQWHGMGRPTFGQVNRYVSVEGRGIGERLLFGRC